MKTNYLAIYHNGENVMTEPEESKLVAGTVITSPPLTSNVVFYGKTDAQIYMTITHDGRLEIGPGLSTDRATKEIAKLLVDMFERTMIDRGHTKNTKK